MFRIEGGMSIILVQETPEAKGAPTMTPDKEPECTTNEESRARGVFDLKFSS